MSSIRSPHPSFLHSAPSFESQGRRLLHYTISGTAAFLVLLAAWSGLRQQVFSSSYLPHLYCYLGTGGLVWTHVIADSVIGISYLAISITLGHIVYRGRRDIPFHWMFLAFGLFIVACGLTHFMEVVTVWVPVYVLSAVVKGFTAVASMTTAIAFPFIVAQILLMVRKAKESDQYLHFLESGLSEKQAEHGQLKRINELLTERVQERTVELARANEELRSSAEEYRILFESNPMPLWVYDRDSLKFLAVNQAAIRHYGYSRDEFLAMTIADIRPEDDVPRLKVSVSRGEVGLSRAELWRHRKKDGSVIDVEITSHPIHMDGKDAELILAHDVTEQRKYQEHLRQSEERFATAFRSSPIAITISAEQDGRYLDANETFLKMVGYEREQLLGRTAEELGIGDPDHRGEMLRRRDEGSRGESIETIFRTHSGEERRVQISAERIVLGEMRCVLANILDVTQSRRLEEQFRQAQKMEAVGRLAGGVAHDFNNLLSVMMGYSEIAQGLTEPGATIYKHLDQIKQAGGRAAALTRQLLAFSRQQVVEPRILNLNAVVHSVHKMLLRVIGEDISLVLRPADPLGSVKADLGQLEQVLMNLAVNARDAMPHGGKIIIETANVDLDETYARQHPSVRTGSYVMLSFSDTGHGMDPTTLSRVFEPFFTTKEAGRGTGLGLSTVYGIVKQSGGHIWVYSEPQHGATFRIYFPRLDRPAETLTTRSADFSPDRGTGTILVVEDDKSLRALVIELLEGVGYKTLEAADGNQAIEIAESNKGAIDLVLTDVIMPGMSGTDLAVGLRRLHPRAAILFMSGYASDLIVRAGVPDVQQLVLSKPFTRKSLLTKVRAVLDQRTSHS